MTTVKMRSTKRLPFGLSVPKLRLRHKTPGRRMRSAALFVGSTLHEREGYSADSMSRIIEGVAPQLP